MDRPHVVLLVACLAVLVTTTPVVATPVLWDVNGHYYELVNTATPINWNDSRDAAAASTFMGETGYLVTVTSQAEQDALFALLGGVDALSNHWLGGFQPAGSPEAGGGWQWVTGEAWAYTNWGPTGEPNNSSQFSTYPGEGEDGLQMHFGLLALNPNAGHWNDFPRTAAVDCAYLLSNCGYIVEYNTPAPVPEPSSLLLLGTGLAGVGGMAWRRKARG